MKFKNYRFFAVNNSAVKKKFVLSLPYSDRLFLFSHILIWGHLIGFFEALDKIGRRAETYSVCDFGY